MKKLWQKNKIKMNTFVEEFETKDDLIIDYKLIPYDVEASIAHVKMLFKIGILTLSEQKTLEKGLKEILKIYKTNKFIPKVGDEDIHTKIENYLTKTIGPAGEKIHTARSRNDQALTAIRLFTKKYLEDIEKETKTLGKYFVNFGNKYSNIPMPGYTHMQKAMPSSITLWTGSFSESLNDDLKVLKTVYDINDQSPLGSAAGYGLPMKIDKKFTAWLLNFAKVQENPIYCQNSRGKIESITVASLVSILQTINKFCSDALLFTTAEFNYFSVSDDIVTGSSIMPQKKNLDLAELLRSKLHIVLGNYQQIVGISSNLITGYNRDIQDTKKPLIESLEITLASIKACKILLKSLTPNEEVLKLSMTKDLYKTKEALTLVAKGKSFRQAYMEVGKKYLKGGDNNEN